MSDKELSRKARDRQRREEEFLEAAELLFSKSGYADTSMEDVAKQAEYATGTIYRYFESKEMLYRRILLRKGELYFSQVSAALSQTVEPLEQLHALVRSKIHFFCTNRNFMRIYTQEVSRGGAQQKCQIPEELQGLFTAYQRSIVGVLTAGIKQGVFRDLDPELLLLAYTGFVNELLTPTANEVTDLSETELENFIFAFLRGGLITEQE
jgi:AcrR family transcriptional regulator